MTETITKDKTLLVLAFAVTFLAGAAVFEAFSDYEAEAKPKEGLPPVFEPINDRLLEILREVREINDLDDAIHAQNNIIIADISVIDGKADGIKSVVDTIDAKVP